MINTLNKIKEWLGRILFPDVCISCAKDGELFCIACLQKIQPLRGQECPECFRASAGGTFCLTCKSEGRVLDFLLVGASYQTNPIVSLLIKSLKYKKLQRALSYLPYALFISLEKLSTKEEIILVPVPLHKGRMKERGFNQATVIASHIHHFFEQTLVRENILERIRYTIPQATLSRQERLTNVSGAFAFNPTTFLDPKKLYLLVDDVATTRSTLEECASILKNNGAKRVGAFVLARH